MKTLEMVALKIIKIEPGLSALSPPPFFSVAISSVTSLLRNPSYFNLIFPLFLPLSLPSHSPSFSPSLSLPLHLYVALSNFSPVYQVKCFFKNLFPSHHYHHHHSSPLSLNRRGFQHHTAGDPNSIRL